MKNTEVAPAIAGHNASPDLRSWLQRLAATDRLAVTRSGISLIDDAEFCRRVRSETAKVLRVENIELPAVTAGLAPVA